MEAAHVTWRPLGELFVERGLITQDELEEALVEQHRTRKRLGAILVSRGLVSGPELTSVLVDQLGMELTKESGFGSGLWDEIRRRHPRTHQRPQAPEVETTAPTGNGAGADHYEAREYESKFLPPEPPPVPPESFTSPARERQIPLPPISDEHIDAILDSPILDAPIDDPVEQHAHPPVHLNDVSDFEIAEARARFEAAFSESRAELEAALAEERAGIEASLAEERAGRRRALDELTRMQELTASQAVEIERLSQEMEQLRHEARPEAPDPSVLEAARRETSELESRLVGLESLLAQERREHDLAQQELERSQAAALSRPAELDTLAEQIDRLRGQVDRNTGSALGEQQLKSKMAGLESRVGALESALAQERTAHQGALQELDFARGEARAQAIELRASLDRIRAELTRLDAATTWFEYWSGAATPTFSS